MIDWKHVNASIFDLDPKLSIFAQDANGNITEVFAGRLQELYHQMIEMSYRETQCKYKYWAHIPSGTKT